MPFIPSSFNFLWSADLSIPIKSAVFEMFPWFFFNWVVKYSFSKYFLASLSGDEKDLSNKFLLILEEIEGFTYLSSFEDSHYYISENLMSWSEASVLCQNNGGELAVIESSQENQEIAKQC